MKKKKVKKKAKKKVVRKDQMGQIRRALIKQASTVEQLGADVICLYNILTDIRGILSLHTPHLQAADVYSKANATALKEISKTLRGNGQAIDIHGSRNVALHEKVEGMTIVLNEVVHSNNLLRGLVSSALTTWKEKDRKESVKCSPDDIGGVVKNGKDTGGVVKNGKPIEVGNIEWGGSAPTIHQSCATGGPGGV